MATYDVNHGYWVLTREDAAKASPAVQGIILLILELGYQCRMDPPWDGGRSRRFEAHDMTSRAGPSSSLRFSIEFKQV